jgi:hypothetical protein
MLPRAVVQFDTPRRGRRGQHSFAGRLAPFFRPTSDPTRLRSPRSSHHAAIRGANGARTRPLPANSCRCMGRPILGFCPVILAIKRTG